MKNTSLVALLLGFSQFAAAHSNLRDEFVYMQEVGDDKQIVLSHGLNPSGDPAHRELTPLTAGNLWHLYPDLSSDGEWLAYAEGAGAEQLTIQLRNLRTGVQTLSQQNRRNEFASALFGQPSVSCVQWSRSREWTLSNRGGGFGEKYDRVYLERGAFLFSSTLCRWEFRDFSEVVFENEKRHRALSNGYKGA